MTEDKPKVIEVGLKPEEGEEAEVVEMVEVPPTKAAVIRARGKGRKAKPKKVRADSLEALQGEFGHLPKNISVRPPGMSIEAFRKAVGEYQAWARALQDIIWQGAALEFFGDNDYQFVLPPRLVQLVYNTTVGEMKKVEEKKGKGEPVMLEGERVADDPKPKDRKPLDEEEEREAGRKLAEMRAQMVKDSRN
jgi:hypothetical protein